MGFDLFYYYYYSYLFIILLNYHYCILKVFCLYLIVQFKEKGQSHVTSRDLLSFFLFENDANIVPQT